MTLKKWAAVVLAAAALAPFIVFAADVALVYEDEAAAEAGRSWPAVVTSAGAAVAADRALGSQSLLIGDADGLFKASLVKLDNDVNLAILRKGEKLENEAAQAAHAKRWTGSVAFLGGSTAGATSGSQVVTIAPTAGDGPFAVKINGREVGGAPVVLKERFNKSKFRFEVVNTGTAPVWGVESKMTSSPDLSFWKEGRRQGLNDVPEKTFVYSHQAVFKPLRPGASFVIPVEVYFIKEKEYVWTVSLQSKSGSSQITIPVRFE